MSITAESRGSNVDRRGIRRGMGVALACALLTFTFGGPWCSFAQVLPAGTTGTQMDRAGNGVPVVQIAAPNGRGVSHNQYQQFNVDPSGLILNNSAGTVRSQLGGYIEGNPNLGGTPAGIILNEVTSLQPSQLRGYLEVAGPRAEVIVANPNGITCEGCGFINTSRGVLTTGTPVFGGDGSLSAFRVSRGRITVQGQGLDGSGTGRIDLLARAVEINAGLWANKLNIVTGANEVGHADLSARAIQGEGEAPQFSLDVAGLGGMYAQKIRLVGTEAGVGVRSAGALVAQGGDFVLTSAGDIRLSGRTAAAGDARIAGQGTVELSGTTSAEGRLTVEGAQIALGGTNYAGWQLQAISSGALTQSGQTLSEGAAELRGHVVRVDGAVQGDTL
ncbi:MAG: filamentous hemagglutinin N-terminal domain-containing protein, partial [Xanthomonadaceae bacterium]|nr:filamentous hemagglutinin N-terminal domain-containing protein [Xanthomonadaceae bacterium]